MIKIFGILIPLPMKERKIQLHGLPPIRWRYLKGFFSFVTGWKMKKVEGTVSFPDPMVNGILYGWMSAARRARGNDGKIDVTINFLGENWLKGDFTISLKTVFHHFRSWVLPLICEMKRKKSRKGGETSWKRLI